MEIEATDRALLLLNRDLDRAAMHAIASGVAALYTARCPGKESANEDAAALIPFNPQAGVLAVADGFGGQPSGEEAARIALKSLAETVDKAHVSDDTLRTGILNGFEKANERIIGLGIGAATTLAAMEIEGAWARPYHVGDSVALVVGQRGRIKYQTVMHSPIGYAVEAGLMEEDEALHHEDRHFVSNMVGSADMRIEIGPRLRLRPKDTVLLASDGLFDNLPVPDIVELIRKGPLESAAAQLSAACDGRMRTPEEGQASKPDDLTLLLFRLNA